MRKNYEILIGIKEDPKGIIHDKLKAYQKKLPLSFSIGIGVWMDGTEETCISIRSIAWEPNVADDEKRYRLMQQLATELMEEGIIVTLQTTEVKNVNLYRPEKHNSKD